MPSYGPPITTEQAKKAASAALAEARANNWTMAAAVVDPAGILVYFEKIDDTQNASSQNRDRQGAFRRAVQAADEDLSGLGRTRRHRPSRDDAPRRDAR